MHTTVGGWEVKYYVIVMYSKVASTSRLGCKKSLQSSLKDSCQVENVLLTLTHHDPRLEDFFFYKLAFLSCATAADICSSDPGGRLRRQLTLLLLLLLRKSLRGPHVRVQVALPFLLDEDAAGAGPVAVKVVVAAGQVSGVVVLLVLMLLLVMMMMRRRRRGRRRRGRRRRRRPMLLLLKGGPWLQGSRTARSHLLLLLDGAGQGLFQDGPTAAIVGGGGPRESDTKD